jgi:L-asparaginase
VDDGQVSFYRTTTKRHTLRSEFDVSQLHELAKVDIVYSYVGAGAVLRSTLERSC